MCLAHHLDGAKGSEEPVEDSRGENNRGINRGFAILPGLNFNMALCLRSLARTDYWKTNTYQGITGNCALKVVHRCELQVFTYVPRAFRPENSAEASSALSGERGSWFSAERVSAESSSARHQNDQV
jgi:hypothetical protein